MHKLQPRNISHKATALPQQPTIPLINYLNNSKEKEISIDDFKNIRTRMINKFKKKMGKQMNEF
jgi:hypothetical protein